MNQNKADKLLCSLFVATAVFTLVSSISSGITWSYWKDTLNRYCRSLLDDRRNCSCILYAESTQTHFYGGSLSTCAWIYFGPIPVTLISISMAIYHGLRGCFGNKKESTRNITTKNEDGETIIMQIRTTDTKPNSHVFYIISSTLASILTIYMLGHFSTFADGYLYTCKQYRKVLIRDLSIAGTATQIIETRLGCNAVYDFMDYLQPISGDTIRDNFINTAGALITGILSSFLGFASLFAASIINIKFAINK